MQPGLINPNRGNQIRQEIANNENLLRELPGDRVKHPTSFWISLATDICSLVIAGILGYFYLRYLASSANILWSVGVGSLILLINLFATLLTHSFWRRVTVVLAQTVIMGAWFVSSVPLSFMVPTVLATATFLLWGEVATRREMENGLEIQFFRAARGVLNKGVTALVLFGVLVFLPFWSYDRMFLPQKAFTPIYSWAANVAHGLYPEVSLTGSFSDFVGSLAKFEAKGDFTFINLPETVQSKVLEQVKGQIAEQMRNKIGVNIGDEQPMHQILYDFLRRIVGNWESRFGQNFLFAWAVIVFLIVRSIAFLGYLVLSILAFFLYQIFLAMDWLKIVGESRIHEKLDYSKK